MRGVLPVEFRGEPTLPKRGLRPEPLGDLLGVLLLPSAPREPFLRPGVPKRRLFRRAPGDIGGLANCGLIPSSSFASSPLTSRPLRGVVAKNDEPGESVSVEGGGKESSALGLRGRASSRERRVPVGGEWSASSTEISELSTGDEAIFRIEVEGGREDDGGANVGASGESTDFLPVCSRPKGLRLGRGSIPVEAPLFWAPAAPPLAEEGEVSGCSWGGVWKTAEHRREAGASPRLGVLSRRRSSRTMGLKMATLLLRRLRVCSWAEWL